MEVYPPVDVSRVLLCYLWKAAIEAELTEVNDAASGVPAGPAPAASPGNNTVVVAQDSCGTNWHQPL